MTFTPVTLITGGSSGIGAACVREFLAAGWNVSVVALADSNLDEISSRGILTTGGDITSEQTRGIAVRRTLRAYGRIDALINNAGVGLYAFPTEVPIGVFSQLLEVNVVAPLAFAQLVIPAMREQGGGMIVNVNSVAGMVSLPWAAAYGASKSALHALHHSLRRELHGSPVQLIEVCPGVVDTKFREHVLAGVPPTRVRNIRKIVSAETVAAEILRAIEHRRKMVYIPRIGAVFTLIEMLLPSLMDLYLSWLVGSERYIRASLQATYSSEQSVRN